MALSGMETLTRPTFLEASPYRARASRLEASPYRARASRLEASPYRARASRLEASPYRARASRLEASPYRARASRLEASPYRARASRPPLRGEECIQIPRVFHPAGLRLIQQLHDGGVHRAEEITGVHAHPKNHD